MLCNGIGASLDLLEPFVSALLPPDVEVVSFDVPGVGGSALPRVPYNFALLSLLLRRVAERARVRRRSIVLGISWGGGLAQQFAFQNPRRCRRLVLVSTATGYLMVPAHPRVLAKMVTPAPLPRPRLRRLGGGLPVRRPAAHPAAARQANPARAVTRSGHAAAMRSNSSPVWAGPACRSCRCCGRRTLVLAGNDDPIIPLVNARMINRLLPAFPAARLRRRASRAGHARRRTRPDRGEFPSRARLSRPAAQRWTKHRRAKPFAGLQGKLDVTAPCAERTTERLLRLANSVLDCVLVHVQDLPG